MTTKTSTLDDIPSPLALATNLERVANLLRTHGTAVLEIPGVADQLSELLFACRVIELEMAYALRVDQVIGDLPAIERRLGASPRPTGRFHDNAGTLVYVAYDAGGEVLYVGVTDDLFSRMNQHRRQSRWWRRMARIDWEEWPDRAAALTKELTLIRRYRPPYNIAGNPDAKGRP